MRDWARHTRRRTAWYGLASAAVLALGLAACDDGSSLSAEEYYRRAAMHFNSGDPRASIIELKNALQKSPTSAQARFLLGRAYLEIGDNASAEKELRRARDLGVHGAEMVLSLGQALMNQARYQDVLTEFPVEQGAPPATLVAVFVLRGHTLLALGQDAAAARLFARALDLEPDNVKALVGAARIALARGAMAEAERQYQAAAEAAPNDPEVLSLEGDMDLLRGRYGEAEAAFKSLTEVQPNRLDYRLPLAFARIADGNAEQAVKDLAPLLAAAPDHPGANYLRALAALRIRDYQAAKTYSEKVLAKNAGYVPAKLLSAAASFALNENEQAFRLAAGYVGDVPSDTAARRLLGATLLRLGQPEEAVARLHPIIDPAIDEESLMRMVATAALRSGYRQDARESLRRVALNQPDNSQVLTDLGSLSLGQGDTNEAISNFEKALEKDPDYDRAAVGIVLARLKAGQLEEALAAAERFRDAHPDRSLGPTLIGIVQVFRKDLDAARAAFGRALQIQPGAPDAGTNLASLELLNGKVDRARELLHQVLKHTPGHIAALLRLAQVEAAAGRLADVIPWIQKAIESSPKALEPKVLLARVHLQGGEPKKALDLAQPLLGQQPENLALREVIGRAQLALGRPAEAVLTLRPVAEGMPDSADAQLLLANAYRAAHDQDGLRRQLDRVLAIDPANVEAKIYLASALAGQGELGRAQNLVAELQAREPDRPDVLELAGGLALLQNRTAEAVEDFRRAAAKQPTSTLTMKLAMAQQRAGDREGAVATLSAWLDRSPEDLNARALLGVQYVAMKRLKAAESTFLTMLEVEPDNVVALNNLAEVGLRLGQTDDALGYARRAAGLAPKDPGVMDTLGMALLGKDEVAEAVSVLEKAARALPGNPEVNFHLARALARNGDTARARDILRGVLASERGFDGRPEAEKLLRDLGS